MQAIAGDVDGNDDDDGDACVSHIKSGLSAVWLKWSLQNKISKKNRISAENSWKQKLQIFLNSYEYKHLDSNNTFTLACLKRVKFIAIQIVFVMSNGHINYKKIFLVARSRLG